MPAIGTHQVHDRGHASSRHLGRVPGREAYTAATKQAPGVNHVILTHGHRRVRDAVSGVSHLMVQHMVRLVGLVASQITLRGCAHQDLVLLLVVVDDVSR